MVKFGVTSWVWVYPFDPDVIQNVKKVGFDGIEIPPEDPGKMDKRRIVEMLKSWDLKCSSICAVLSPDRDLIHPDKGVRDNAKRYIRTCIDFAVDFESDIVCGPLYSCVDKKDFLPSRELEWKYAVSGLKELGKYAEDRGVYLGIEPLNRFETRFINLVSDCVRLLNDVDSPAVKAHFDTFHANIEEKSLGEAIRQAGERLYHVHACENDRGTPGSGHIPWDEVAKALKEVGYARWLVIETFQPGIKEIATAASIWRPLAASQDEIAVKGLEFLRSLMV